MEEILNSQEFLMTALSGGEDLFLPPRVGSADYPFTYVLFSPATPWPGKSLTLDFDRFVSSIGGETEGPQIFPTIARATFANAHPVCADMTRAARRINHCARVLQFCRSLSRKRLNMLSGLVAADESFLFLTPDPTSRVASSHVIAASMWPQGPICAFDLDDQTGTPISLRTVLGIGEQDIPRIVTEVRRQLEAWLRQAPVIIPRPKEETSFVALAKARGLQLAFALPQAAPRFVPPPPVPLSL
jgi:hypothetical protein